jgi:hypothetical protein
MAHHRADLGAIHCETILFVPCSGCVNGRLRLAGKHVRAGAARGSDDSWRQNGEGQKVLARHRQRLYLRILDHPGYVGILELHRGSLSVYGNVSSRGADLQSDVHRSNLVRLHPDTGNFFGFEAGRSDRNCVGRRR